MAEPILNVPANGAKITIDNGVLKVPSNPIIPFIEGDGTGADIWRASVRVFDAAVEKVYGGARKIHWMEVYAGEKANNQFGNWLPDANVRLSQLLASMVTPSGKVAVAGFYDDVPPFSPAEQAMMRAVPDDTARMKQMYGLGSTDGAAASLQEGLNLPAFSVHMMKGGEVGGVIAASRSDARRMTLKARSLAASSAG